MSGYKDRIKPQIQIHMKCPNCKGIVPIRCGKKSEVRVAKCRCGKRYEYSCWKIAESPGRIVHKIEAFEVVA